MLGEGGRIDGVVGEDSIQESKIRTAKVSKKSPPGHSWRGTNSSSWERGILRNRETKFVNAEMAPEERVLRNSV